MTLSTEGMLKMSELAERSGVSAGTIKHYLREGLLGDIRLAQPPERPHQQGQAAPARCMITHCWQIESRLFQDQ